MAEGSIASVENNTPLTKQQVQDVIDFAAGLMAVDGWFSPFLSNQLLQNLNNNRYLPNASEVRKALADYKNKGNDLQDYVGLVESFDMLFKRTLYSYVNALSFGLSVTCTNAYTEDDYKSAAYLRDKKIVDHFLTAFDYKKEFRNVVANLMRNEIYFTWFRKTKPGNRGKMKYALQMMPQDYCMLTGYFEKGLLWSFNVQYFMQAGVDINSFDPSLSATYKRVLEDSNLTYRPSAPLAQRNGVYAMWADVSPNDGAWAWKFNLDNFNPTPFLAPFLKDTIESDDIGELQYNKDMASAYAILAGELRLFDNAKSGTQANQFAIDPKQVGAFLSKAKQAIGSYVKLAALPTENNKWYQYTDENKDMYDQNVLLTAAKGSSLSRIIYSTDRMSNMEVEYALNETYRTMEPLYSQFNNFLDFYVNKMTTKYHFKFEFSGSNYRYEQESRFDKMMKLADKGIVLPPSQWAAVLGMNPVTFERSLRESKYTGWLQEFSQMMLNVNTSSNEGGRPRSDSSSLTDSAEGSRDTSIYDGG